MNVLYFKEQFHNGESISVEDFSFPKSQLCSDDNELDGQTVGSQIYQYEPLAERAHIDPGHVLSLT